MATLTADEYVPVLAADENLCLTNLEEEFLLVLTNAAAL
jgi:hypothetical protein